MMSSVPVNPLWVLIDGGMREHNLSYRQVEEQSAGVVRRGELTNWRAGRVKLIPAAKLRAAANVLSLNYDDLIRAALETAGYPLADIPAIEDAIRRDTSGLDELAKRELLRVVSELRARSEDLAARDRPEPRPDRPLS